MPSPAFHTGNGEDRPAPRGYQSTDVDNAALLGPFEVRGVNQQHWKLSSVVDATGRRTYMRSGVQPERGQLRARHYSVTT